MIKLFRYSEQVSTGRQLTITFIRASFGQGYRYPSIAEKYASTTLGFSKDLSQSLLFSLNQDGVQKLVSNREYYWENNRTG